jgi:mono/diheme cytochrome c family protein
MVRKLLALNAGDSFMSGRRWVASLLFAGAGALVWAQEKPQVKYVQPENISAAKGPEMFRAYCAACHGVDGRGGGPAADSLKKRPADLTQLNRKYGGKYPALRVANVIQGADSEGVHGSRDMPVWGAVFRTLGDQATVKLRTDNLVNYVESLQRQ